MSKRDQNRIVIRMNAARHDVTIQGETVDLSGTTSFVGRHGEVKINRDGKTASNMIVGKLERDGFFGSNREGA